MTYEERLERHGQRAEGHADVVHEYATDPTHIHRYLGTPAVRATLGRTERRNLRVSEMGYWDSAEKLDKFARTAGKHDSFVRQMYDDAEAYRGAQDQVNATPWGENPAFQAWASTQERLAALKEQQATDPGHMTPDEQTELAQLKRVVKKVNKGLKRVVEGKDNAVGFGKFTYDPATGAGQAEYDARAASLKEAKGWIHLRDEKAADIRTVAQSHLDTPARRDRYTPTQRHDLFAAMNVRAGAPILDPKRASETETAPAAPVVDPRTRHFDHIESDLLYRAIGEKENGTLQNMSQIIALAQVGLADRDRDGKVRVRRQGAHDMPAAPSLELPADVYTFANAADRKTALGNLKKGDLNLLESIRLAGLDPAHNPYSPEEQATANTWADYIRQGVQDRILFDRLTQGVTGKNPDNATVDAIEKVLEQLPDAMTMNRIYDVIENARHKTVGTNRVRVADQAAVSRQINDGLAALNTDLKDHGMKNPNAFGWAQLAGLLSNRPALPNNPNLEHQTARQNRVARFSRGVGNTLFRGQRQRLAEAQRIAQEAHDRRPTTP